MDSSENDGGVQKDDGGDEQCVGEVVVEEVEEEVYQIDEEKLENVVSLLQNSSDGSLESSLDDMDLTLHQDFVIKVFETTPIVSGDNLMRFFKWAWNEKSFKVTTPVVESLVVAICSSGLRKKEIYSLWDLVKDIGEKENGVINVGILNELIISCSKLGKGKAALEVFDKFEVFQCVPDSDTYYFTIEALCRRSAFDWACSVCQKMLDAKILPDGEKVGSILAWLCKGKKAKEAHAVYVAAIEERKYPPMSSVNFLVAKLCQENETVQLALEMLNDIPGERRKHATKPFLAVVRALCRIKDVDAAKQLILKMIADGPPPGNAVFNFVITAYSKVGEMGQAVEMMKLLESRGLKPDVYTYAVIASGYSNGGEMEEARKILEEAKKKHVKLSPVLYHTLIRGYCKIEQFDEALKLLTEMKDYGVRSGFDEYDKLIQSLCLKALDWETAEKLQEEMKENGLYLKGITRALIKAVKEMEKEVVEAESISAVA
ncbi:Tetratricopeptide-like helical domain superfamily [Sesbania bispinosa]|nr:Tetratricopeptide-like helical domain superfamily [Sesbania bispinosa]